MATVTREQLKRDADALVNALIAMTLASPINEPNAFRLYRDRALALADIIAAALAAPPADETPYQSACDRIRRYMGWTRDPREAGAGIQGVCRWCAGDDG